MSRLKLAAYRLPPEIITGLEVIRDRDGIFVAEQVRRALREWIADRGVTLGPARGTKGKAAHKRPSPRKRH